MNDDVSGISGAGEPFELNGEDQPALDALMEAGFEVERVPAELRERARRVAALMGLIDQQLPVGLANSADALIDLTLARVHMQRTEEAGGVGGARLSPHDEDALEALVGADYDPADVAAVLRKRAARHADLLAMLEPARAELAGSEARIARTLSAVQSSIDARDHSFKIEPAQARRRFRIADIATAAALLLIASAAVGPMVGAMREQARRSSCQANLMNVGQGLASYATDSQEAMPMASASVAGNRWWNVGKPENSNSANLYRTVSTGYTKIGQLACAGNPDACRADRGPDAADWGSLREVSYSYQNMFSKERPRWNGAARVLVVVDGSPVVRRAFERQMINPFANSMNHAGQGQSGLYTDGNVEWLKSPVLANGDNIWLPGVVERAIAKFRRPTAVDPIEGNEAAETKDDVFMVP